MKSQKEIDEQVEKLVEIRDEIKPYDFFGGSNLDKLDAQVRVLEEDLDSDDIGEEWPEESDMEIRTSADEAVSWREDESDIKDLATDWPML